MSSFVDILKSNVCAQEKRKLREKQSDEVELESGEKKKRGKENICIYLQIHIGNMHLQVTILFEK